MSIFFRKISRLNVLTGLFQRKSFTGHRDLLLRCSDPVQHASPAFHGEGEVGACGRGALVDTQHWEAQTIRDMSFC